MSGKCLSPRNRTRFLVMHDDAVALEQRGSFRSICLALTERGADVHVIQAGDRDAAHELARDAVACAGYDAVLVAGNASTLEGTSLGLAYSAMPVGILPVGPGDMIGRALGLHGKPHVIAAMLCEGPVASLPALQSNETPVPLMAGFGTDANIMARLSQHLRPGSEKGKSSVRLAKDLVRPVERFNAIIDGMNYRCCCLFAMRTEGFGALSAAAQVTSDTAGPLTVVLIEADDRVALFDILVLAKVGRMFRHGLVNVRRCQHVEVPGGQNLAFELNGVAVENAALPASGAHLAAAAHPLNVICAPGVAENLPAAIEPQAAVAA